jgi:hypothetical protein
MNRVLLFRRRNLSLRIAYIQYEQVEENANVIKVLSGCSGLSVPTPTQCSRRQRRWPYHSYRSESALDLRERIETASVTYPLEWDKLILWRETFLARRGFL